MHRSTFRRVYFALLCTTPLMLAVAPVQAAEPAVRPAAPPAAVSKEEVQRLVQALDRGRQAWIEGKSESGGSGGVMVQSPEMIIFPPFGGEIRRDNPQQLGTAQARTAAQFKGGTGSIELVESYSSGDLLVLVLMERNQVVFDGSAEPRPWILRTTQVFRRDGARWVRLHRHADPLLKFRTLPETLALY